MKTLISTLLATLLLAACAGMGAPSGSADSVWERQQDEMYGVGGGGGAN